MTDTRNLFAGHAEDQAGHDRVIMHADDARDLIRLRTLVRRLFMIDYMDELEKVNEFAHFESARGTPTGSMMREIATLCGLRMEGDNG